MPNLINETGNVYNRLTVVQLLSKRHHNGEAQFLCQCECGNETIVTGYRLRTGHTRSCGCLLKFPPGEAAFNSLYNKYKYEAGRRNKKWNISKELFRSLTSSSCYYCGISPLQETQVHVWNKSYLYNGIDRLNNNVGYIPENCVSCCGECNMSKRTRSEDEFYSWIKIVYERRFGAALKEI